MTASIRSVERMTRPGCRFRFLGPMRYAITPDSPPLSAVISSNRTLDSHRFPFWHVAHAASAFQARLPGAMFSARCRCGIPGFWT